MNEEELVHKTERKRTGVLTPKGAYRLGRPNLANHVVNYTEITRGGNPVAIAEGVKTLGGKKLGLLSVSPDGIVPADSPPKSEGQ